MLEQSTRFQCGHRGKWRRQVAALAATLLLGGCVSEVPESIRLPPSAAVSPAEARADPQHLVGVTVRWGGIIAKVENRREQTVLEVVARPLGRDGSPLEVESSHLGRFLARVPGFLDPALYEVGRAITVRGQFEGVETKAIGEFPYRYPVVDARQHFLWQPPPEPRARDYDPYWYDPWYPFPWWHRPPYYW